MDGLSQISQAAGEARRKRREQEKDTGPDETGEEASGTGRTCRASVIVEQASVSEQQQ
jgi:hypothetical protein